MNQHELRSGVSAGFVAAAATAGALLALGRRDATAASPFNMLASHLIGSRAVGVFGFVPSVTLLGLLIHVVLVLMLALVILDVVRRRLSTLIPATLAAVVLCALVSVGVARRGGNSLAQLLPVGDLIVYYAVLSLSLMVGIRLALPPSAIE